MSLTKPQALEMFESDDLIGIGMEADAVRRQLHPEGVVTYIIDRNINYTNFCTEYCTFCAFYRPLTGPAAKEGYILDFDTIYEKIRETVELGGTGVLMQGGLHPDLKIDWHEKMLHGIKERFPQVHLHCYSASEIIAIAEYSSLSIRETILRLRDAGLDSIPGGGAEILDDGNSRRRSTLQNRSPEMPDRRLDQRSPNRPPDRHAHHRDHDVRRERGLQASHKSFTGTL
ncbi:MAG: radical SAM protein [Candidatus Sulfotelmatobacter sp.]